MFFILERHDFSSFVRYSLLRECFSCKLLLESVTDQSVTFWSSLFQTPKKVLVKNRRTPTEVEESVEQYSGRKGQRPTHEFAEIMGLNLSDGTLHTDLLYARVAL